MTSTWEDMANRTLKTAIGVFKVSGVFTPAATLSPPSVTLNGVFDRVQHSVDMNTGASVDSYQPSFGIAFSDLTDVYGPNFKLMQGDTLLVDGVEYRVNENVEDGQGGSKLMLSKDGN